jgi:hypothetical protein
VLFISRPSNFHPKADFTFALRAIADRSVIVSYGLAGDWFAVLCVRGGGCSLRSVDGVWRAVMGAARAGGENEDEQDDSDLHCACPVPGAGKE